MPLFAGLQLFACSQLNAGDRGSCLLWMASVAATWQRCILPLDPKCCWICLHCGTQSMEHLDNRKLFLRKEPHSWDVCGWVVVVGCGGEGRGMRVDCVCGGAKVLSHPNKHTHCHWTTHAHSFFGITISHMIHIS